MKILNRGFIKITPTPTFIDWAKTVAEETPFFDANPESTIYLIEDDFWEEEKIIERNSLRKNSACISSCTKT